MAKAPPLSDEDKWSGLIYLLNNGGQETDAKKVSDLANDLILRMEGGLPFPDNCVIKPGLTRVGFTSLLYLIRNGADALRFGGD